MNLNQCSNRHCNNNITFGKLLGQGSFGLVYEGKINNEKIAIKELPFIETIENHKIKKYSGMFGQSKDKSKIEIEILHNLNKNIVPELLQYWETTRCMFLALEFLLPVNWTELSKRDYQHFISIFDILSNKFIVYTDFNENNFMRSNKNNHIKISDWGPNGWENTKQIRRFLPLDTLQLCNPRWRMCILTQYIEKCSHKNEDVGEMLNDLQLSMDDIEMAFRSLDSSNKDLQKQKYFLQKIRSSNEDNDFDIETLETNLCNEVYYPEIELWKNNEFKKVIKCQMLFDLITLLCKININPNEILLHKINFYLDKIGIRQYFWNLKKKVLMLNTNDNRIYKEALSERFGQLPDSYFD